MKHGAECNTDHQLLCIKIRITHRRGNGARVDTSRKRFDVFKLTRSTQDDSSQATAASLVEAVESKFKGAWSEGKSGEEK